MIFNVFGAIGSVAVMRSNKKTLIKGAFVYLNGLTYRNGLLYAVLSASDVFYMLRIAYSSLRE